VSTHLRGDLVSVSEFVLMVFDDEDHQGDVVLALNLRTLPLNLGFA
jgi:hypothetical protein